MKKITRIFSFMLMLGLVTCISLTGCDKKNGEIPPSSMDLSKLSEMTLEYWCLGPGVQKRDAEIEAVANQELQKSLPHTSVHYTWIPSAEIVDKVTRALAANENIDMLWMGYSFSNATKETWCRDETFEDLSKLGDTYLKDYYDFVGTDERKATQIDDKDYFIIGWQGLAYGRHGVWASTELLQKLGYDPKQWVKSVEELAYAAYQPQDRNMETEAKWMDFWYEYCDRMDKSGIYADDVVKSIDLNVPSIVNAFRGNYGYITVGTYFNIKIGDDVNAKDYRLSSLLTPDENLQKIIENRYELMGKWYDNGWIRKDIASSAENGIKATYENANSSSWGAAGGWKTSKLTSHNMLDDPKESFVARISKQRGHDMTAAYLKPTYYLDPGKSTMSCIPFTVKENGGLERALMFQNYLYTDACDTYFKTIIYGREGIEWDWNDSTKTTATWRMGNSSQGASDWEYGKAAWYFGNCLYALPTSNGGYEAGYYQMLASFEKNMWNSPYVSFAFDSSSPEITLIMSNLQAISKEYTTALGYGYLGEKGNADYYKEYRKKMIDNGLETLEKEVLKQVQAYAKKYNITSGWQKGY